VRLDVVVCGSDEDEVVILGDEADDLVDSDDEVLVGEGLHEVGKII